LYISGYPDLFHQEKKGGFMDSVLIIVLFLFSMLLFITFVTIPVVRDVKVEINKKLCDEKIRYTKQKTDIEMKALEEKKKKGIYPFSPPPQK